MEDVGTYLGRIDWGLAFLAGGLAVAADRRDHRRVPRSRTATSPHRSPGEGSDELGLVLPQAAPILKTLPPHFGHVPWSAGLPFFMVIRCGFWTSTFILSLTQ